MSAQVTGWQPVYDALFAGNLLDLGALPLAREYDLIVSADARGGVEESHCFLDGRRGDAVYRG